MSHRPPRDSDSPDEILHDDCDECARRANELGIGLDSVKFTQMWDRMLAVEYRDEGAYLNDNEAKLGQSLCWMSLLLQRHPRSFKPFRIVQVYAP